MINELWWIDALGVEYQFNEEDLGVVILDGALGFDAPPHELNSTARPGDGSILKGRRHAARPLTIPLYFTDASNHEVMGAFAASFNLGPGQLRHVDSGGNARNLRDVYYDSGFEGNEAEIRSDWARRVLNLIAFDPFWYGDSDAVALGPPEGDIDYDAAVDYDAEIPYDGAAAGISSGQSYDDPIDYDANVPYDGGAIVDFDLQSDLGVWPTITVRGPATYVQVIHLGTGEVVETLGGVTIPDGRDLLVVTRPEDRTILLAGTEAWDRVTTETSASMMLKPGTLTDLRDEDGVQVRDELGRVIVTQGMPDRLAVIMRGTSAASWVRIAWEERWLCP